ncbi:MAG: hypothetical protein LBI14_10490 [Treponema sp.]|nr:hypothetical protein [Treponema sp.]
MHKKLLGFIIGLAVIGAAVFIFFNIYEIEDYDKYVPPSREAQLNEYLALDRWLASEGHAVRVENRGNLDLLKDATAEVILIQERLFTWNKGAIDYLDSWVEQGGRLILCVDSYRGRYLNETLQAYLDELGIAFGEELDELSDLYLYDFNFPTYGRNIILKEPEPESEDASLEVNILMLKDVYGYVRLMQFVRGNGTVTVMGTPRFMTTNNLRSEPDSQPNTRLSWYLLAHNADITKGTEPAILFIRGVARVDNLLGRVFMLGNFGIIIIAGLILIAIGFWSVLPLFGVIRGNEEKPGKFLAERFLAEGRFLKRFGVLDQYRNTYFREIRRKFMKHEDLSDEEIIVRSANLLKNGSEGIPAVEKAVFPGRQKNKDFIESIKTLRTILERI